LSLRFRLILAATICLSCADESQGSPPRSSGTRQQGRQEQPVSLGINQRVRCTISRISDGDSVVCDPIGRVRLLLIDAPELADGTIGREARQELNAMMPVGTKVIAETDVRVTDQFGRVLAYLFLPSGRLVNEEMARSGYATTLVYPPNVKYVERIRGAVAAARKAKLGLWAKGGFDCLPRDYRAGRCR
jgi:micrococcal nuclease